jgi:hypothetical protein
MRTRASLARSAIIHIGDQHADAHPGAPESMLHAYATERRVSRHHMISSVDVGNAARYVTSEIANGHWPTGQELSGAPATLTWRAVAFSEPTAQWRSANRSTRKAQLVARFSSSDTFWFA